MRLLFMFSLVAFLAFSFAENIDTSGYISYNSIFNQVPNKMVGKRIIPPFSENNLNPIDIQNFKNNNLDAATYWTKFLGNTSGNTGGYAISTDSSGNSFVTGSTNASIFGTSQTPWDYYVAKYDTNGNLLCGYETGPKNDNPFGNSPQAWGDGIVSDGKGNIYIVGWTTGGLSGQAQQGNFDYFIAKYDSNCNLLWSKQFGNIDNLYDLSGNNISIDSIGNLYIVGSAGGSSQSGQFLIGYFVAKHDANGNLLWLQPVTFIEHLGLNYLNVYGIHADSTGNSYIAGYTDQPLPGQSQTGSVDYLIAKYDTSGKLLWSHQVGSNGGMTFAYGISLDSAFNSYVGGTTNIGISGQTRQGYNDYFIAQYNSDGNLQWTREVGASGGDTEAYDVSVDSSNTIYTVGYTNVGISGQPKIGIDDYFIASYDSKGNLLKTQENGIAGGYMIGNSISIDSKGYSYTFGSLAGSTIQAFITKN